MLLATFILIFLKNVTWPFYKKWIRWEQGLTRKKNCLVTYYNTSCREDAEFDYDHSIITKRKVKDSNIFTFVIS